MRFRHIFIGVGGFLVTLIWLLSDPDMGLLRDLPVGASTVATIIILLKSILYVGMLHFSRKALLDYMDLEELIEKAKGTPSGAGSAVIGVGIMMVAIALVIYAATSS